MTDLRLILGECTAAMRAMPEGSVDAIVTDPPYGLEFMGKAWDKFRVDPRTARWSAEKSGGAGAHIREDDGKAHGRVAFHKRRTTSVCRTCGKRDAFRNEHACGERADWTTIPVDRTPIEARAFQNWCETWALEAYRVLKPGAHMLAFGGSRTHHRMISGLEDAGFDVRDCLMWLYGSGFPKSLSVGDGWGTALKPSYEAIVLVRKPLGERSVAANVARFGTGALNVDGSRIGDVDTRQLSGPGFLGLMNDDGWEPREVVSGSPLGRWPANVTLDEAAAALLDEQSGELVSGANPESRAGDRERVTFGSFKGQGDADPQRGVDAGGASRFFYTAKADSSERNAGLYGLPARTRGECTDRENGAPGSTHPRAGAGSTLGITRNHHPTVKPVSLMSWLVRLVTPAGGTVLDPFMGSGSTGIAARRLGFGFVGIEQEAEYMEVAQRRIEEDAPLFDREAVTLEDTTRTEQLTLSGMP